MEVTSRRVRHCGVSLLEMIIALVVFSAVVFPVVSITTKATGQLEDHKNTSVAKFEWTMFFADFQKSVGLSYRFFPLDDYKAWYQNCSPASSDTLCQMLNPRQQVFMAYSDNGKEKRVGYEFAEYPSGSGKWYLKVADIPIEVPGDVGGNRNARVTDYTITSAKWKKAGKVLDNEDFYFTGEKDNNGQRAKPQFWYCQGANCAPSISPRNADGIKVLAADGQGNPKKLIITYRNSEIDMDPIYIKLAALQFNQMASRYQLMPFPIDLTAWNTANDWVAEKCVTGPPTYFGPVVTQTEAAGTVAGANATFHRLPLNDMHYNVATGQLLAVTRSANDTCGSLKRNFYIYQFAPGKPDSPRYQLQHNGAAYEDKFPVVIREGDPAYPGQNAEYKSVTQDRAGNIYVLVDQNATVPAADFFIQKFSPEGNFITQFYMGGDVYKAYGLTYSFAPGDDQYIMALIDTSNVTMTSYKIRAYNKDQNGFGQPICRGDNTGCADTVLEGLPGIPNPPNGLDFDTVHNHFIVSRADRQIQNFSVIGGPPLTTFTLTPGETTCYTPQGVAYDATRNTLFVSTQTDGALVSPCGVFSNTPQMMGQGYRRVIPTVALNPRPQSF